MIEPYIITNCQQVIGEPFPTLCFTFEWIGDKSKPVFISNIDREIYPLPWKLKPVGEYDYARAGRYYVRADSWTWPAVWIKHKLIEITRPIKYRIIVTLVVWGMARYEPGRIPQWRDIGRKAKR